MRCLSIRSGRVFPVSLPTRPPARPNATSCRPGWDRARSRTSAYVYVYVYVYVNILVLTAVAGVDSANILDWSAFFAVAGTTITTFLAPILAHSIGQQLGRTGEEAQLHIRDEVRDSLPIASSGSIPALMMLLGAAGIVPPLWAQLVAALIIVGRLAFLGILVEKMTARKSTLGILWSGVVLAGLSVVIVGAKIFITH